MKKIYKSILLTGILFLVSSGLQANGLVISNLTRNAANQTVTFDIQWFNSWRVDSSGAPYNWDAAWIFIKFRQCGAASTTPWTHGKINPTSGFNSYGNMQPHSHTGSYWSDSLGVMLRRDVNGIFPSQAATTVTLTVDNIPAAGSYDVKVFGIETVYVPQGSYEVGISTNYYSINDGAGNPLQITSEGALTVHHANSNFTNNSEYIINLPAAYPKGYGAFYSMKYEVSQGQYAAFLNTLPTPAQLNRFLGNVNQYRNRLDNTGTAPDVYVSDREDRAQNCMDEDDLLSYLDWSGLRPMTELEYEKACRGEAPSVPDEYAWGTNTITQGQTISTSPEDGTETIFSPVDANAAYGNYLYGGGDGGRGPLRVGIFADPTDNDRVTTGASYYGIMDLSGNVFEMCVNTGYTSTASAFNGELGNGSLTTGGLYDASNWKVGTTSFCLRGGSYYVAADQLRVSYRNYRWTDPGRTYNGYSCGGRGVR